MQPSQIVVIGASAGGVEAFKNFFAAMPPDSGLSFVVVLHLSPSSKSLLAEIIGRWTAMPVSEVRDGDAVQPDHVYVVPPGVIASMQGGAVRLNVIAPGGARPLMSIDAFFTSVAADQGPAAVGIVMSGTGKDGSLGLRAIKLAGGITMAQVSDGSVPQYSGMPDSAIATGYVDLPLGVDEMPAHLMRLSKGGDAPAQGVPAVEETDRDRLRICAVLLKNVGHDFSHYKDKTFLRRVERRMQVLGRASIDDYIAQLQAEPDEAHRLFRDLLIGVTQFFRDQATFDAVEEKVIPRLFDGKTALDSVRVWVPGCATGEEAYSLAMLLREHLDTMDAAPRVQIFATDIDDAAIETARIGCYPLTLMEGLRPDRLARFFFPVQGGYMVNKSIRDMCTFSPHSLVRDPPFSRMDLISCRNLLIYMDSELQANVIPSFHYSLTRHGFLLLGRSETVIRHEALFTAIDKEHRIFSRRDGPTPVLPPPPPHAPSRFSQSRAHRASAAEHGAARSDWSRAMEQASSRVLERFAAPYAVVTADGELLHYSSRTGNFLQPAVGQPSRSIFDMAREGLTLPLRAALRSAVATGQRVEHAITNDPEAGETGAVTLIVEPLANLGHGRPFLIIFRTPGNALWAADPSDHGQNAGLLDPDAVALIARLDSEMQVARDELQALTEEHNTALEEVRSSNEELHSLNEELQLSNEELETSKEEIQSINEELQTVNGQLTSKLDELDRANGDLRHLFESTSVATIFLDQHFLIRNFTPEVANIYNLIPSDHGRSLDDIVSALDYGTLRDDVQRVLETQQPLERRASRRDRTAHYLCRIILYRSPLGEVEGTLVTFVEVTSLVRVETQQMLIDELNHRVKNMLAVVMSLATQSAIGATTIETFQEAFGGRLQALSFTYGLLGEGGWTSVGLAEIISGELRPFRSADGRNITVAGPALGLNANAALVLGMVVHELATNAVKYGALSNPVGRIDVRWEVEDGKLSLNWTESGGPATAAPPGQGFGMTLIDRSIAHELDGHATFDFAAGGLHVRVDAPTEHLVHKTEPTILRPEPAR